MEFGGSEMESIFPDSFDMDTDPYEVVISSEISDEESREFGEQVKLVKVLPQNHREIYENYKNKNYRSCIALLQHVQADFVQYRIIKSACLIHMDDKTSLAEAHKILDETLEYHQENAYAWYAKGLALYREGKWEECIKFLEKSIALDPGTMERAELLRDRAQDRVDEEEKQRISKSQAAMVSRKVEGEPIVRRFGCEIW